MREKRVYTEKQLEIMERIKIKYGKETVTPRGLAERWKYENEHRGELVLVKCHEDGHREYVVPYKDNR